MSEKDKSGMSMTPPSMNPDDIVKAREEFLAEARSRNVTGEKTKPEELIPSGPAETEPASPFPDAGFMTPAAFLQMFFPQDMVRPFERWMETMYQWMTRFYPGAELWLPKKMPRFPSPPLSGSGDVVREMVTGMKTPDIRKEEQAVREVASYGTQLAAILDTLALVVNEWDIADLEQKQQRGEPLSDQDRAKLRAVRRFRELKRRIDTLG